MKKRVSNPLTRPYHLREVKKNQLITHLIILPNSFNLAVLKLKVNKIFWVEIWWKFFQGEFQPVKTSHLIQWELESLWEAQRNVGITFLRAVSVVDF